jgi:hypothetical protein
MAFFAVPALVRGRPAPAAELLGDAGAQQAGLAGPAPQVGVDVVLLRPTLLVRRHVAAEELPRRLSKQRKLVSQPIGRLDFRPQPPCPSP